MTMRPTHGLIPFGMAIWILIARPAWPAVFEFTTIVDTGSSRYKSLLSPSINDNGTVAFIAQLDAGGTGVFTVSGDTAISIADSNGTLIKNFIASTPSLNNSGEVAFVASLHADQYHDDYGIFVGTDGPLTAIADSTIGGLTYFMPPSINNAGDVAFGAVFNGAGERVYLASGGELTELVGPNGSLIGSLIGHTPINDAGIVAFVGQTNDGLELFSIGRHSAQLRSLVTLSTTTLGYGSSLGAAVAINNSGDVLYLHGTGAFKADEFGQVSTVVEASEAPFQSLHPLPIVDDNGVFVLNQSSVPSINDRGLAVFFAVDQMGNEGIYLTSNPGIFQPIVQTGNTLGGSTVMRLVLSPEGINNPRKIAFLAELADGRELIVIAFTIPEPDTSSLILLFGVMAVCQSRLKATRAIAKHIASQWFGGVDSKARQGKRSSRSQATCGNRAAPICWYDDFTDGNSRSL